MYTRFLASLSAKWNSTSHSGSIFRNMAMLASGSVGANVIGVLSVPVITRIYQPEHFGILAIFTSLTALLVPLGTLRYSAALPLPKRDGTALNLAVLCVCSLLLISLLVTLLFWIAAPALLEFFSMRDLLPFWWLIPIAIAGTGLYELLSNWAIRKKAFPPLAKARVWQALSGAIIKIGLGFLGLKPLGLLIGQVFTQAGGGISLAKNLSKSFQSKWSQVSFERISFLARRYADFPMYRLPSQFLLILSNKAPLLFFAWQFGAQATGQLGLALTMVALPITLFGQTTGQAYYAEIAHIGRKDPEKIYRITKSITKKLFLVSVPPFLILLIFGPVLFEIVFGNSWKEAGFFSSILAIYLLTQLVSNPIINSLSVLEKQAYFLQINITRSLITLSIFYISFLFNLNTYLSLIIFSITMSIYRLYIYFKILQKIRYCR